MPEDCPEAFEIFVSWLYSSSLPYHLQDKEKTLPTTVALVRFDLLADKLLLPNEVRLSTLNFTVLSFIQDKTLDLTLVPSVLQYIGRLSCEGASEGHGIVCLDRLRRS